MEENKRTRRNKKNSKKNLVLFAIIVSALFLIILIFILLNNNSNSKIDKSLLGLWTIDGKTDYKFSEDGKGELIVPLSKYSFTYKIEDDKLYIDFDSETSKDSVFEYFFEDGKMIWKNIETTGTFTFTKK